MWYCVVYLVKFFSVITLAAQMDCSMLRFHYYDVRMYLLWLNCFTTHLPVYVASPAYSGALLAQTQGTDEKCSFIRILFYALKEPFAAFMLTIVCVHRVPLYSETCLQRPPKGPSDGGLCRQVILVQKCISITEVAHGAAYSGLYRQVVLVQKCISITEVAHGAAYSGLCRQVILIQRCISITEVALGAAYSGHYRQVVLIQRCISITEVALGAAYSGLYRQVVLLYKWSLRQVHCIFMLHYCYMCLCIFTGTGRSCTTYVRT